MIIIDVKKEGSLDKALKKLKKKFKDLKIAEKLLEKQFYEKPSVKKRELIKKAIRKNKRNEYDRSA